MTISEALDRLEKEMNECQVNPREHNLYDDEDIIIFAIEFLISNLDDAFSED